MDLKEFLKNNPLIRQAELARLMWPEKQHTATKLANKLAGTQGQRITDEDKALALKALAELCVNITELKKDL